MNFCYLNLLLYYVYLSHCVDICDICVCTDIYNINCSDENIDLTKDNDGGQVYNFQVDN